MGRFVFLCGSEWVSDRRTGPVPALGGEVVDKEAPVVATAHGRQPSVVLLSALVQDHLPRLHVHRVHLSWIVKNSPPVRPSLIQW